MRITAKDFQVSPTALLFEPEFYIFDFSADLSATKFLMVDERKLDMAPFVDIRFEPLALGGFSIPSKELFALEKMHNIQRPQSAFIFHHAFVCSTLLARCLNQIDAFFSLKEPWILRRLSDTKRAQRKNISDEEWKELFESFLFLLAKNYHGGQTPVIKATNVANNLIEDILRYLPEQKILYLYSDLESFLVSNLKKHRDTQMKMPGLAKSFLSDGDFAQKYPKFCDLNNLSFLQICSLIWVVSLYNFKTNTEEKPSENVRTLDMNHFLTNMENSLNKLCMFFNYTPTPGDLNKMLAPSVIQTNAKHQALDYGKDTKQAESALILTKFKNEIDDTVNWINPVVEKLRLMDYCNSKGL